MKIREIKINPLHKTIDLLTHEIASELYTAVERYRIVTSDYTYTAYEVFPQDRISDILENLYLTKKEIQGKFNPKSQIYYVVNELIKYFENR